MKLGFALELHFMCGFSPDLYKVEAGWESDLRALAVKVPAGGLHSADHVNGVRRACRSRLRLDNNTPSRSIYAIGAHRRVDRICGKRK